MREQPMANPNHDNAAGASGGFRQPGGDRQSRFFPLYVANQRRIFAYVFAIVPNRADAEDVLQETSIVLWEKFNEVKPGTDFLAWACQIAFWKIGNLKKKYARARVKFDQDVIETIGQRASELAGELDDRCSSGQSHRLIARLSSFILLLSHIG